MNVRERLLDWSIGGSSGRAEHQPQLAYLVTARSELEQGLFDYLGEGRVDVVLAAGHLVDG